MKNKGCYILIIGILISAKIMSQQKTGTDVTTPLHALQPDYPTPYGVPKKEDIKAKIDKVFDYLNTVTPAQLMNKQTGAEVTEISQLDTNTILKQGDFRLTSYEWGVTYSAMQRAFETTRDQRYADYVKKRFDFLAK